MGDTQNNPRTGNPYEPTKIKWNDRGILNTAQFITSPLTIDMGMSIVMGVHHRWMVYDGECHLERDDDWG